MTSEGGSWIFSKCRNLYRRGQVLKSPREEGETVVGSPTLGAM
jgi:hypothetical protein